MKTKTAPSLTVISKEVRTTIKDMMQHVGDLPKEIFKVAVDAGLHPTGPQYWIYTRESDKIKNIPILGDI